MFTDEERVIEHAAFYEKVYRAAKDALKDAGLPIPPSGKWSSIKEIQQDKEFESYYSEGEDDSAIRDGYLEADESDVSPVAVAAAMREFDRRLEESVGPMKRHEILRLRGG